MHPGLPEYRFRAVIDSAGVVTAILAAPADGSAPAQVLRPSGGEPSGAPAAAERMEMEDVDFDGYGDLSFGTVYASAGNARRDHWRFEPRGRRFAYLGEFDAFTPDSARRVLTTFNQSGGGYLWTAGMYRFENGALALVRRESQEAADEAGGRLIYRVTEMRGGRPFEVVTDTVAREKARTGPSWAKE